MVPLHLIRELNPIDLEEHAMANGYSNEPAFRWWVSNVLNKCDRLVKKIKSRFQKNRFNFGVEVPQTVQDFLRIDCENGNTLCHDSIGKEMNNSRVDFNFLDRYYHAPVGYKYITCHLIFYVKMELNRKDRYMSGGHLINPPSSVTYASTVRSGSVCLAFLIVAFNDLDILVGDIRDANLNAPKMYKVFFFSGDE